MLLCNADDRVGAVRNGELHLKRSDSGFVAAEVKNADSGIAPTNLVDQRPTAGERRRVPRSVGERQVPNRVVRVDGIKGRVAAYHAAAEASNTPWMFIVFAKLRINSKFDFSWQPDRLQIPKHYIFYASNPVNGLVYGHQAMIAYNKCITLSNMGKGLDFTLDNEHEVVELNSGVARYNTDEFSTWRTSFREAIKLRLEDSIISKQRLKIWSTVGEGDFAQYSINGALDAVEYYESVNGNLDKLRLSYDWPWLKEYFNNKYKL